MHEWMAEVNVQTTLAEPLYELLWRTAKQERRPIKAIVREAIESYLRQAGGQEDPLLSFVGHGRLKETDWSKRKDWRS